jgi:hypothetical protein
MKYMANHRHNPMDKESALDSKMAIQQTHIFAQDPDCMGNHLHSLHNLTPSVAANSLENPSRRSL